MTVRILVTGLILLVAACTTSLPPVSNATAIPTPAAPPQSAKERFVRATELNGCEVNAANANVILSGATLSREDLARIMSELTAEGRGGVAADGQSFRLLTEACA
ncbi:MAG: hypothetical protein AAGF56_01120 [Pseudomonadota bacterium]